MVNIRTVIRTENLLIDGRDILQFSFVCLKVWRSGGRGVERLMCKGYKVNVHNTQECDRC